jgi:hypothetical protein
MFDIGDKQFCRDGGDDGARRFAVPAATWLRVCRPERLPAFEPVLSRDQFLGILSLKPDASTFASLRCRMPWQDRPEQAATGNYRSRCHRKTSFACFLRSQGLARALRLMFRRWALPLGTKPMRPTTARLEWLTEPGNVNNVSH